MDSSKQALEETLRRLAHALHVCINPPKDREKGIVSLTQEDYLCIHKPWAFEDEQGQEADEAAEYAFMDELLRAREALTWRALAVAHWVGRAMGDYVT